MDRDSNLIREAVIAEAMSWLMTPYHHHACVKGKKGGVDCAHFPIAVYAACGVIPHFDPGAYAPTWHLHRSEERYLERVLELGAREIESPQQADFALYQWGRCYAHGVIVIDSTHGIHADGYAQAVELCELGQGRLADRPVKFFEVVR